jgi:uncharacterized membrane protein YdjX (TVP38/TMEM64 family)
MEPRHSLNEDSARGRLRISLAAILLGIIGLVILGITGHLGTWYRIALDIFSNKESLRLYVESWGAWAPLAFILIQGFQVVFAPIPGEFTGAVGGFIFGAIPNVVYSTIGLTLGSVLAFILARIVGQPIVQVMVGKKGLKRFEFLQEKHGLLLSLVLFTIPGFPKDILSYMLGLSPMGFFPFLLVCFFGRIPGTIMLSVSGAAVFDENWTLLIIVSVVCLVLVGGFFLNRNRIEVWIKARNW